MGTIMDWISLVRIVLVNEMICYSQCVLQSYASLNESVLGYYITVWYGRITSANKVKPLDYKAGKSMGSKLNSIDQLAVENKAFALDITHTLNISL